MSLNVTLKYKVAQDLNEPDLADAFRQVETWANAVSWSYPKYASGWSDYTLLNNSRVRFRIEPFDTVRLAGVAIYSGALSSGSSSLIFTLPAPFVPRYNINLIAGTESGIGVGVPVGLTFQNQATGSGVYINNTNPGTMTDPLLWFDGLTYTLY